MSHPARPARRPHLRGAAALCAVLLPLVGACASGPDAAAPHQRSADAPATSTTSATVSYGMPADVTAMVLPTTGEASRQAQGLDAFGALAAAWAVDDCARRQGETVPDSPPPMFTRYSDLPDLDFLREYGFGGNTRVPGAPHVAPAQADAAATPSPALRQCLTEGGSVSQELRQIYGPLRSGWFTEMDSVNHTPEAQRAWRGFGECLAGQGVDAKDEAAFFALADRTMQAADTAGSRRLGAFYSTCMKPVEAVREPLRERAAERFLAANSAGIARLHTELPRKIGELEKRYEIRISFPKI
ncbi:hypothetical protein ACFQ7J_17165 [Streptomyces sp. NPDC056501]|uniref:hypothetical protein n=1 Tax=Streptomyces sp. NPDC056501 TaxID=3345841 RepID=UPI003676C598